MACHIIIEVAVLLQCQHCLERIKIIPFEEMGIVCRNKRNIEFLCHGNQFTIDILLASTVVTLQFDKKAVFTEHRLIGQCSLPGTGPIPFLQTLFYFAVATRR